MSLTGLSLGTVALQQSRPPFHPATISLRASVLVIQLSALSALFASLGKLSIALGVNPGLVAFRLPDRTGALLADAFAFERLPFD